MARNKVVPAGLAGPVDRAVRGLYGASWGKARAWIASGKVRVSGTIVDDATVRVSEGAEIVLDERAPRPRPRQLEDDDVVHSDAQVIVVTKPAGLSTVPYDETETDTLDLRVRAWLQRRGLAPRGARPMLGIVHRLDKETTGLVVFTRTWLAKQELSAQFRRHAVYRRYLAIAHGTVRAATIRSFLLTDRGDGLRGSALGSSRHRPADAREAITHVEPLEPLAGASPPSAAQMASTASAAQKASPLSAAQKATLIACRLETGRTHQIRIHLSEGGHPILGERVYIKGFAGPWLEAPRLMLHATALGFVHPTTQREMRWEQPMPTDMVAVLERLRR